MHGFGSADKVQIWESDKKEICILFIFRSIYVYKWSWSSSCVYSSPLTNQTLAQEGAFLVLWWVLQPELVCTHMEGQGECRDTQSVLIRNSSQDATQSCTLHLAPSVSEPWIQCCILMPSLCRIFCKASLSKKYWNNLTSISEWNLFVTYS